MIRNLILATAGNLGAWALTRRITRNVPRIFMFHRFQRAGGMTDADELVRFIDTVGAECEFLTVTDLARRLDRRISLERPMAAITVDDGYADFYDVALPILVERSVPATLYATAGFVNGQCWLWWDALRFLLDIHPAGKVDLEVAGQSIELELGAGPSRRAGWSRIATQLVTRNEERARVMAQLEASAHATLPSVPPAEYAAVSWAQLVEIESAGIEIGGHTMTHAFLPGLNADGLRFELDEAKALMEAHLHSPLTTFAYPNGMPEDCTPAVVDAVRAAGFTAAVLAHPRHHRPNDRYRMGRWSVSSTEARLGHILSGASVLKLAWQGT